MKAQRVSKGLIFHRRAAFAADGFGIECLETGLSTSIGRSTTRNKFKVTLLRQQLQQMTEEIAVEEHPAQIELLRAEFGHTIQVVESESPIGSYTHLCPIEWVPV